MHQYNAVLEKIYDEYSPMLFGIALALTLTKKDAEELLILTFKNIQQQQISLQQQSFLCVTLIRLIIQTAHNQHKVFPLNNKLLLRQFESTPILNQLFFEQVSLSQYCIANELAPAILVKKMQLEFGLIKRFHLNNNSVL